ncbi:MAG: DUF3095 domain-containing protein [Symploca sp. SIO2B6]|nr:DUF3095 domain-containing protein [Symploca sp. SIO2B6]
MSTEKFYSELPALDNFFEVTDYHNFAWAPSDWYILITDVVDSTQAIEAGLYKEVNLLGACSIGAVVNIAGNVEIPFIFGGDGASILIPSSLLSAAKQALLATKNLAKHNFNLDLRVGVVPIAAVNEAGYKVKVAKFKVFDQYQQAVFSGGGINYATALVKNPDYTNIYSLNNLENAPKVVNLSGVCCPWQDLKSLYGEINSLIVTAMVEDGEQSTLIYQEVLAEIQKIYGIEKGFSPFYSGNLKLTFKDKDLNALLKTKSSAKNLLWHKTLLLQLKAQNLIALAFHKLKIEWKALKCVEDKQEVIKATDYQKFSDTLNMIISGTPAQRKKLVTFLEQKHKQGKLVYGLHTSDRALITCYVNDPNGCHVHFVDGADGGYTLAAKAMKKAAQAMQSQDKLLCIKDAQQQGRRQEAEGTRVLAIK